MSERLSWHIFDLARQRHTDLLFKAECCRLVKRALSGSEKQSRFYCRALAWLGHRLVIWGWRLQERYGAPTTNWQTH